MQTATVTDFTTLEMIEDVIQTTMKRIDKNVSTDDDVLINALSDIAQLGELVTDEAEHTREWTCYSALKDYDEWLFLIYCAIHDRLMSN